MICKNCNATIPDNVQFCPRCGGKVEAEPAAAAPVFSSSFHTAGDLGSGEEGRSGCEHSRTPEGGYIDHGTGNGLIIGSMGGSKKCSCGANLRSGVKFCPVCGKPCQAKEVPPYEQPHTPVSIDKPVYLGGSVLQAIKNMCSNRRYVAAVGALTLAVVIIIVILGRATSLEHQLVGSWYVDGAKSAVFTFYSDGTCEIGSEYGQGKWSIVNDNQLKLTNFYGETLVCTIESLSNGCLMLREDGSSVVIKLWDSPQ